MSTTRRLNATALAMAALLGYGAARAQSGEPIGVPMNPPPPAQQPAPPQPATQPVPANNAVDPPGRVGRIADTAGQVWLYHPEAGEWVTAQRNLVLTTGDRLATDAGARTEVRIGSSVVRLDGGAELEVLKIDDDRIALQLHDGSAAVRLRTREAAREFELRTAEGRFTVQRPGRYRFDRGDDASQVTVYNGQSLYEGPGSALTVNAGQRAEFFLDRAGAAQYTITDPVRDDFAGWAAERDRADDRSAAARYVSPEMTGVEDLDRHGRWQQTPEYGAVWAPTVVAAGWAPYTAGRWAWVSPWGWTWVDDAPWGFAPFHYGRWVYYGSRWCWAPGTYVARPVYAPALVGWVGGNGFSVRVAVGAAVQPAVGWVPLAPREVYVPTYRVSPGYVQQVNITHVTNITNITTIVNNPQVAVRERDYQNRKYPNAVTVVPTATLAERRPVGPAAGEMRLTPAVREIVERPTREMAVVAPSIAPAVRRVDAQPMPAPGARIEPPGRGRMGAPERPAVREVRPAAPTAPPATAQPPAAAPVATPERPQARPVAPGAPVAPAAPVDRPAQRPEVQRPEVRRPEVPRQDVPRQDVQRPEVRRPEVQRPQVRPVEPGAQPMPPAAPQQPPQRPQVRAVEPPRAVPPVEAPRVQPQRPPAVRPVAPEARPQPQREERREERPARGNNRAD